jgi:hypothetical protein
MLLVLPTHIFGEAILRTSKIHNLFMYCSPGPGSALKKFLKIKTKFLRKNFQFFLHGEKENFEEYSLNLASAELSFPTLAPKIP